MADKAGEPSGLNQSRSEERPPPVRAASIVRSLAPDVPAKTDTLDFRPYVDAVADFLLDPDTRAPLTLSIEGAWGTGKTSFMLQLEKRLRQAKQTVVSFSAWRHDKEESLWAAFVLSFLEQLAQERGFIGRSWCAWKLFKLRRGIKWVPAFLLLTFQVVLGTVIGVTVAYLWLSGVFTVCDLVSGEYGRTVIQVLSRVFGWGVVVAGVYIVLARFYKLVGNPLRSCLRKGLKGIYYAERIAFIERLHRDFSKIVDVYAPGQKVIVFIDDLDRCAVPRAADLMQAINLLISGKGNLVFIVGLDRDKVAAALAAKYADVLDYLPVLPRADDDRRLVGMQLGHEFIEKFVQLRFLLPSARVEHVDRFLDGLLEASAGGPAPTVSWRRARAVLYRIGSVFLSDDTLERLGIAPRARHDQQGGTSLDQPVGLPEAATAAEGAKQPVLHRRLDLRCGRDVGQVVREAARMVFPVVQGNPRRLKHFVNTFRLWLYIAHRTGLCDDIPSEEVTGIEPEQLAKYLAIVLRWPDLVSELEGSPDMLDRLDASSRGTKGAGPKSRDEGRWFEDRQLLALLRYKEGPPERASCFSMASVSVERLRAALPPVPTAPVEPAETEAETAGTVAAGPRREVEPVSGRLESGPALGAEARSSARQILTAPAPADSVREFLAGDEAFADARERAEQALPAIDQQLLGLLAGEWLLTYRDRDGVPRGEVATFSTDGTYFATEHELAHHRTLQLAKPKYRLAILTSVVLTCSDGSEATLIFVRKFRPTGDKPEETLDEELIPLGTSLLVGRGQRGPGHSLRYERKTRAEAEAIVASAGQELRGTLQEAPVRSSAESDSSLPFRLAYSFSEVDIDAWRSALRFHSDEPTRDRFVAHGVIDDPLVAADGSVVRSTEGSIPKLEEFLALIAGLPSMRAGRAHVVLSTRAKKGDEISGALILRFDLGVSPPVVSLETSEAVPREVALDIFWNVARRFDRLEGVQEAHT